jgi:dolichol-phosphate mannosyltransferase
MANEGEGAVRFVKAVLERCRTVGEVTMFTVVDGASQDDTRALLEAHAEVEPRLCVVWAPENRCVVDAYVRGYREGLASAADWILEIDAGFSHDPAEIQQFLDTMLRGYDCVFGSRFARGGGMLSSSLKRYLVSRGGSMLAKFVLGSKVSDMTSGFELFSHDALDRVLRKGIRSRAHFFQTEIKAYCAELRIAEVPIHYGGASSQVGRTEIFESLRQLWRLLRERRAGRLYLRPESPR